MYSCIQAKDGAQNITYFLMHHTNARDVCSSRRKIHAFGTLRQASQPFSEDSCLRGFSFSCPFFSYFEAEKEREQQKVVCANS